MSKCSAASRTPAPRFRSAWALKHAGCRRGRLWYVFDGVQCLHGPQRFHPVCWKQQVWDFTWGFVIIGIHSRSNNFV